MFEHDRLSRQDKLTVVAGVAIAPGDKDSDSVAVRVVALGLDHGQFANPQFHRPLNDGRQRPAVSDCTAAITAKQDRAG